MKLLQHTVPTSSGTTRSDTVGNCLHCSLWLLQKQMQDRTKRRLVDVDYIQFPVVLFHLSFFHTLSLSCHHLCFYIKQSYLNVSFKSRITFIYFHHSYANTQTFTCSFDLHLISCVEQTCVLIFKKGIMM